MSVKVYSYKADGNKKLSKNFSLGEFRCRDGSDKILVDESLVKLLQKIRDKFGAVHISSAYRNESYNKKVGGVSSSQHLFGRAADCTFEKGVKLSEVAKYAEKIGFSGIGLDDKFKLFIHLDTREKKSFFKYNKNGSTYSVSTFGVSKTYSTGFYRVNANVLNVRASAQANSRKLTYNELTQNAKKQMAEITKTKADGYVKNMRCSVSEVKGNRGRTPSGWICLDYCTKI